MSKMNKMGHHSQMKNKESQLISAVLIILASLMFVPGGVLICRGVPPWAPLLECQIGKNGAPTEGRPYKLVLVALGAIAAQSINPVLLNEVIPASERHIVLRSVAGCRNSAKGPGAFISIFLTAVIVPCIQIRIRDCLLELVRNDRSHSIGTCVPVRANSLSCTSRWATIRVSYK